jgi:catechol 2,3-dioxygenase-like lactoylglutathione lyase family enzyme
MVEDQTRALEFYTSILGFVKRHEIPMGEYRWLTVVSAEGPDELELSLEPNANPAGKTFQTAMFEQGIPMTAFESTDIDADYERLKGLGVVFKNAPVSMGPVKIAMFSDTCGNWIQLYQPLG